jgi:tetratricopeptide (TPR) repeat protein
MPSLQQLKRLQDLFGEIGYENDVMEEAGRRNDSYDLPKTEPVAPAEPPVTESQQGTASPRQDEPTTTGKADNDGIDFDFNSLSDLITPPPDHPIIEPEHPAEQPDDGQSVSAPLWEQPDAGQFDVGLPGVGLPDEGVPDEWLPDINSFSDTDLDLPDFPPSIEEGAREDLDDIDAGIEQLRQNFAEEGDEADSDVPSPADEITSLSDISDEEKSALFPDTTPEEPEGVAETPPVEEPASPVETSADTAEQPPPQIDDFLAPTAAAKDEPPVEEPPQKQADAINLTEKELQKLLDTIASYPLNLRVTCENIIAEEIVEPALLSRFIKMLVRGGNAREAAALAGKILNKKIPLPKSYKTGEDLEAEQAGAFYIFTHRFLPVIRLFAIIATLAASVAYLGYQFIYKPVRATIIYRNGYDLIAKGEHASANRRFAEAFGVKSIKNWFYRYAERFRDEHQYLYAEEKYDQLLLNYPRDKKGTLDYAAMESDYLHNYEKADRLVRENILDYEIDDRDGLLALGDINLAWGDYDPSRYEDARLAYARLMALYGQSDPIMERMMLYFMRTDKLGEVIPLQNYFMKRPKSKISSASLAELGGYLLDKRFEVVKGVPDEHIAGIEGIKDVLLRATNQDFSLPEAHYHLSRYYDHYGSTLEERQTLEIAAAAFDTARTESAKRTRYRVDTQRRLARLMIVGSEFISAEEALAKGVNIMEDAVERGVLQRAPEFGELYAYLGDLAYFAKADDMREAVGFYLDAEENGWSPPEMQYRLGSAYYRLGEYAPAMNRLFNVSMETSYNRRLLNALGNVSYMRSDYFAAEGYFKRLVSMLESERNRFPVLLPNERQEHREIAERMMVAHNNLGVTYNALAASTGNPAYRASALGEFAEAARAWNALERLPPAMVRASIAYTTISGASLPQLNFQNTLYPTQDSDGLLFMQIDKDMDEDSWWEDIMRREGL